MEITLVVSVFAVACFIFFNSVMANLSTQSAVRRRVRQVGSGKTARSASGQTGRKDNLRVFAVRSGKSIYQRHRDRFTNVKGTLLRAGYRQNNAIYAYAFAKMACPVICAAAAFAIFLSLNISTTVGGIALAPVVGGLLGFLFPDLYLKNRVQKRAESIQRNLADGLDLLVVCAEAGLSLNATLLRVADEVAVSSADLADELTVTAYELNFLPDRKQALTNLAERVQLPTIKSVVSTLIQTEKYGTPLAQSLRVLAGELREQIRLRAEEKAARLPAILTVPMIVFILPTLFLVLAGPAVLDVYDSMINR